MTTDKAKELFKPLIDEFKKDSDVYLLVHFSREEDAYCGRDNMDSGDALIIIRELISKYHLSSETIASMNINPVEL